MRILGEVEFDGPVANLSLPYGTQFPVGDESEIFRLTQSFNGFLPGVYIFTGGLWSEAFKSIDNQTGKVYTGSISASLGTTVIPADATTPIITEGTSILQQTVTPLSASSKFKVSTTLYIDSSTNNKIVTLALFRNSVCVKAIPVSTGTSGRPVLATFDHLDEPNTTNGVTYSLRLGINSNTWYLNQSSKGNLTYGGVNTSSYTILEIL